MTKIEECCLDPYCNSENKVAKGSLVSVSTERAENVWKIGGTSEHHN